MRRRILRIRFAASGPVRSRLAGESCGFALRHRDLFGPVWPAILWVRFAALRAPDGPRFWRQYDAGMTLALLTGFDCF